MNILEVIENLINEGYANDLAQSRVCQDIILKAISESSFSKNVTIKGGVVMRNMTKDVRRATNDLDIDFIRYSLSESSINMFIDKINCLKDINISRIGEIKELRQDEYKGKRVMLSIKDKNGNVINTKLDIGVHANMDIEQKEVCFDIYYSNESVTLLINTIEQMFAEKLSSLLKHGIVSSRYKDIFDIYYFVDKVNIEKLKLCISKYVFENKKISEKTYSDVYNKLNSIFSNQEYKKRLMQSKKNWIDVSVDKVLDTILEFIKGAFNK